MARASRRSGLPLTGGVRRGRVGLGEVEELSWGCVGLPLRPPYGVGCSSKMKGVPAPGMTKPPVWVGSAQAALMARRRAKVVGVDTEGLWADWLALGVSGDRRVAMGGWGECICFVCG